MFTIITGCDVNQPSETPSFQWHDTRVYLSDLCSIHESTDFLVVLYGDLYNCCIGDVFKNPSILANEQGSLCYLVYNKKTGNLEVGTDKLGFGALYYHKSSDGFVIACCLPHIKWRLKKPEANWLAWEEILNTGDILGEKTPLLNVNRLRAGELLKVVDRELELISIWEMSSLGKTDFNADFCEQNNIRLIEALKKSISHEKQKVVPLSGGHDSRRLAISAKHLEINFITITQAWVDKTGYDLDTAIAKVVAKELAVPHKVSPVCDEKLRICNELTKDYWAGFESEYHAWALPMIQSIDRPSLIYDGIVADVTVNAHYMREFLAKGMDPFCQQSIVNFICGNVLFKFHDGLDNTLEQRVKMELDRYQGKNSALNLYMLANHTRRNIGAWINLFKQAGHSVFLPYTDFSFFEHSMAACSQTISTPYLQKECMQLFNPDVAAIPATRDTALDDLIAKFNPQSFDCRAEYPSFIHIHPKIRDKLVFNWKDEVVLKLNALGIKVSSKAWKLKRLKRLSLFLSWLDTSEGDLPATFLQQPSFLENFNQKVMAGSNN